MPSLPAARKYWFVMLCALPLAIAPAIHAGTTVDADDNASEPSGNTSEKAATHLAAVTVAATLNPRPLSQVAADVSVITREDMNRHLVSNLRDLVRYQPGVSVTSAPGRFGQSGFTIRGMGGNRVRIELDGVPISDDYAIGSMLSSGRNTVDMDAIKRVEIVRGPASSLYGSDALGGVVSYVSKDPADYLSNGRTYHVAVKERYNSSTRGFGTSATLALGNQRHGFMLLGSHHEGHAPDNRGDVDSADETRTRPDPQTRHGNSVLAKYVHGAASGRTDRLVLDATRNTTNTDVLSARNATTSRLDAVDQSTRTRASLGQTWGDNAVSWADRIMWKGWLQKSRADQRSFETRDVGPGYERHVRGTFSQRVFGFKTRVFKTLDTAHGRHDLTTGIDISRMRTEELRDGFAINLADGSTSSSVAGGNADDYPLRDFPPTDTTNAAAFVQDEMNLADGKVQVIAGARLDHYRFDPRADALFDSKPMSEHIHGQSAHYLSPKLGVTWQLTDTLNLYGQYASGFRAPPYSDLGLLFSNLYYGYAAIPNPDLKPETSRSAELGLRGEGGAGNFAVAVYANRYRDFIESQHLLARDAWPEWAATTPGLNLVFQSVNLNQARIRGVQLSGTWYLGSASQALEGWRLHGNFHTARGDSRERNGTWQPLNSVSPARAVVGIAYEGYDWGVEMNAVGTTRKHRLADAETFHAPGYTSFDVYAHWTPMPQLKLHAGITNLSDHRYWEWGNLYGGAFGSSAQTSAVIDRYSAPGRAFRVSAKWTF